MARAKKVKKITISELKSYLTGAKEFNDKDWFPNKVQWEKIVDMIMHVQPDAETPERVVPRTLNDTHQTSDWQASKGSSLDGGNDYPVAVDTRLDTRMGEPELEVSNDPKIDLRKPISDDSGMGSKDEATGAFQSGKRFKSFAKEAGETDSDFD